MPLMSVAATGTASDRLPDLIHHASQHFSDVESANLDGLLERIGDSRLVLIGEASHGSAEFYDMRARITRELIEKKGFNIIAMETNWPEAAVIDHHDRGNGLRPAVNFRPFGGFPSWMLANQSVSRFIHWLRVHNRYHSDPQDAVGFYGLDFYNLYGSIEAVLGYLQAVDPAMAAVARQRYNCLLPWRKDPALYSDFMESGKYRGCGYETNAVLADIQRRQSWYEQSGSEGYFHARQNAWLARNAELYYRTKHQGIVNSWNLRDDNLFDSLLTILRHRGPASKAVVWAHNTHIGDARATDMNAAGEINLGQRVRQVFGNNTYLIGFGTDHGTVTAASRWGGPPETMPIPTSHQDSYGHLFHQVEAKNFLLPLRYPLHKGIREQLLTPRLQRGIGSTYSPDPEKEMKYHYSHASLPNQFDEYIWIDETHAVKPQ